MSTHKILLEAIKLQPSAALPLITFSRQVTNSSLVPYFVADEYVFDNIMQDPDNYTGETTFYEFCTLFHDHSNTFQFTPTFWLQDESADGTKLKTFVNNVLIPMISNDKGASPYFASSLKVLFFISCNEVSKDLIIQILKLLPAVRSLEELYLNLGFDPDESMLSLLKPLKNLRKLSTRFSNSKDYLPLATDDDSLIKNSLEDVDLNPARGDLSFIASFKKLKSLCLHGASFTKESISAVPDLSPQVNCPYLESLDLRWLILSEDDVKDESKMIPEGSTTLHTLKLFYCNGFKKFDFFSSLGNCLRELEFTSQDFASRNDVVANCAQSLSYLKNLKKLTIGDLPFTNDDMKTILLSQGMNNSLEFLLLNDMKDINVDAIPHISRCSKLKTLHLGRIHLDGLKGTTTPTAAHVYNLAKSEEDRLRFLVAFNQIAKLGNVLEVLYIQNWLLEEQFELIGENFTNLKTLDLYNDTLTHQVTSRDFVRFQDGAIHQLVKSGKIPKTLTELGLHNIPTISSVGLSELSVLTRLNRIEIYNTSETVSFNDVVKTLSCLTALRTVKLDEVGNLLDDDYDKFEEKLPFISDLTIYQNYN